MIPQAIVILLVFAVFLLLILESKIRKSYILIVVYSFVMLILMKYLYGDNTIMALVIICSFFGILIGDNDKIIRWYRKNQLKAYKRGLSTK
jgi:chromate transport protein ChrA